VDPVGLQTPDGGLEHSVALAREAGMNMLRIPGGTVYEDDRFFRACDRAGILVWQDLMLGPADPPDDGSFVDVVCAEVVDLLDRRSRHPSFAVLCGGQQLEEQPAMFGLSRDRWHVPLVHDVLPALVATVVPGLPFVSSSPSGGDLPFQPDSGVCHYYGVGVCLLPLDDLRRAAPRFVTEGLAFSVPPDRAALDGWAGAGLSSRKEPDWKRAVHRDPGSSFDLEDIRDQYVASLFGVDIAELWRTDPGRALDLGRAATAAILGAAVAEWRRPGSSCAGMLSIALRDLRPGPGWGLVDASGRPKAPWYVLARGWAPLAVTMTDERMNGVDVHLSNDTADEFAGTLRIGLHTGAHTVETASRAVTVPARGAVTVRADALVDGFRDLSYAYRFGPRPFELITADLLGPSGETVAREGFLPGGPGRAQTTDVGLQATVEPVDGGWWSIHVSTRAFAQYVHVDVPGFLAGDSWFHLPPAGCRDVVLRPYAGHGVAPSGTLRALNSVAVCPISA
jgi:beta-mannosidase